MPEETGPSLEDMADTLRYMWLSFMDELDAARRANGGVGDLTTERFGASVAMRIRDYQGQSGAPYRYLDLEIDGGDQDFVLKGAFTTDPDMQTAGPDGIAWSADGDHDSLCAWMMPWVALHIERGGGYIDFDG